MKKNIVFTVVLSVLLFGSSCIAAQPAVIGGVRSGIALGLMLESGTTRNTALRLGFEASTSNTPGIVFVGGKWFLGNIRSGSPMFLSGGLVGYMGDKAEAGPYISLVFEQFIDIPNLFLEVGIDVVKSGNLQLQIGHFF